MAYSMQPDRSVRNGEEVSAQLSALGGIASASDIEAAYRIARQINVDPAHVMIARGAVSEEQWVRAFAEELGLPFHELVPWDATQHIDPDILVQGMVTGILPLQTRRDSVLVVAPRSGMGSRLERLISRSSQMKSRFALTTSERLKNLALTLGRASLGEEAAFALKQRQPHLSAASPVPLPFQLAMLALSGGMLVGMVLFPSLLLYALNILLSLIFIGCICFRCAAALQSPLPCAPVSDKDAGRLPVYTIAVPLYREAASVRGLVASLDALDYPPEKLDIKLLLEEDDHETRAAVRALRLGPPYEVIAVPNIGPRTKPKALNVALRLARGRYFVIFDAEDRPEPSQLRQAVALFQTSSVRLVCVQAKLAIDNVNDGWLTRLFAADYSALFDVFLPALARLRLPVPLGGTSNHFRIEALRQAGGWDAYNVTEDADLGMRLARMGYHTGMIASTTWEEAPNRFLPWLRQRTRWFKGWIQTWFVHMRHPVRLWREMTPAGFLAFQMVTFGTVVSSLIHPFVMLILIGHLSCGGFLMPHSSFDAMVLGLNVTTLIWGYVATVALTFAGLYRRGMVGLSPVLLLTPVYWCLLSLAVWRALFQFIKDPYRWEKTEHGVSRTSWQGNGSRLVPALKNKG